jgi:penicillin-binding protein 1B
MLPDTPPRDTTTPQEPSGWSRFTARAKSIFKPKRLMIGAAIIGAPVVIALIVFSIYYNRFSNQIDARLKDGPFRDSSNIYAAPLVLTTGDGATVADLIDELRTAGFDESASGNESSYNLNGGKLHIVPSKASAAPISDITLTNGQIAHINAGGHDVKELNLGSPLVTTLSSTREQRQIVKFADIPTVLVNATISAEDKHFFHHRGLDVPRVAKAAYVDFKDRRKAEGASTLTMQLVRGLWLDADKQWKRKTAEALMAIHLERKWTKEEIFETYANQIYLGRQAAYSIHGFGEASKLYFGKDLSELTLPEAALLAGMIQRPAYFNPVRSPQRTRERRDLVLKLMRNNKYITDDQYGAAIEEPAKVLDGAKNVSKAPYFLDLVNDEVQNQQEDDPARNVYTTVDLNLQHAADEAIRIGMEEVDKALAKRPGGYKGPKAEAALIAIDPHTGEIKAIVGGRDYQRSQLNRILSKRPPGSVFKPFVYAAALNTGVVGGSNIYTPATVVDDTPITLSSGGKAYTPSNFKHETLGTLTLRQALAHSNNIAAVKVAEGVGLDKVVAMARSAGLNDDIQPTPAVALGAYQVTPLEIAGAYTMFANGGMRVKPVLVKSTTDENGAILSSAAPNPIKVLDPRVTFLMVSMLEEVMRSGTAAGVRSRGFLLPAAGKTGTSHDGWFAGFTSQLLCIVWVGFDDYSELNLEGAKSALPIWAEFMKRAAKVSAYKNATEFKTVRGIASAKICKDSGKLASSQCPNVGNEYFVYGTVPADTCDMHKSVIPDAGPLPGPPVTGGSNQQATSTQ